MGWGWGVGGEKRRGAKGAEPAVWTKSREPGKQTLWHAPVPPTGGS